MVFDAAGVRAASAGLGALAGRATANGRALIHAAHEVTKLPEDGVGHGFRAGASAFLGSPEGKAALTKLLEAGWSLLRGLFLGGTAGGLAGATAGGGAAHGPQVAQAQSAPPSPPSTSAQPPAATAERAGTVG